MNPVANIILKTKESPCPETCSPQETTGAHDPGNGAVLGSSAGASSCVSEDQCCAKLAATAWK